MVLIASCASSIVLISMNSMMCGSSSWLTISNLSPEVLIDESAAIFYLIRNFLGYLCFELLFRPSKPKLSLSVIASTMDESYVT